MAEDFETLQCWIKAKELCLFGYRLINKLPKEERFALGDQLRRSLVSIPSNIAESLSRKTLRDRLHLIDIAIGSIYEAITQVEIAYDLGYIEKYDKIKFYQEAKILMRIINGYKNYRRNNERK